MVDEMTDDPKDRKAITAGDLINEKKLPSGVPEGVDALPSGEHDELMPLIAPELLDTALAPESKPPVQPEVENLPEHAPVEEAPLVQKPTAVHLAEITNKNYAEKAIEEALGDTVKFEQALKKPEDPDQKEGVLFSETPLEQSIREIGLKERPTRETMRVAAAALEKHDEEKYGLPRIRTYAADMSKEIKKRGATLASIATAEQIQNAKEGSPEENAEANKKTLRKFLFIGGAVLFLVLGGGSILAALILNKPVQVNTSQTSLIPVNHVKKVTINLGESLPPALAVEKNNAALNLGEIEEVMVTEGNQTMQPAALLAALGAPDTLTRNATAVMVGVHAFDHNQPFILINVSAYDRAFAAMLSWESTMDNGLGEFFAPTGLTSNSSATAHPPALTFTDGVFQNVDIRESQPEWHIVYAFLGQNLLVITTNESTLREIITRLSLQSSK